MSRLSHACLAMSLAGCGPGADYTLSLPDPDNAAGYDTIEVSADVALQRNNYGETISRCQIQLAFSPTTWDEQEADEDKWVVTPPDEPGTCAFSVEPEPTEAIPGEEGDDWAVSGSLIGPDQIALVGEDITLLLSAVEVDGGALRYELPPEDCDDIDFPFGAVFDLDVSEGEVASSDGLPGFVVEQALAIGPDVTLTAPSIEGLEGDRVPHPQGEELVVRWALGDSAPEVGGVGLVPEVELKIYNQDRKREHSGEWLVCWPEADGGFTVPAQALSQLTANEAAGGDRWFASVTVHTITDSPPFEAPWGEPVQLRAHISEGGMILLYDEGVD
ncbi:MAG: hypothetical protein ACI8S6_001156 [Myxococcota bacterium]|jgi:hypothetical protein